MDRLRAMSTFVAVAQSGSLSAAARKLAMPLTTISRQLAMLEAHLGATLVTRTTRHLALTEAGRSYLDVCARLLEDLAGAESRIARGGEHLSGTLDVTAPIVFGRLHVLPTIGSFLDEHPRLACRLTLDDRNIDLPRNAIDVAIRIGKLANSSLIASKIGSLKLLTCASPEFLAQRGAPETPADLTELDCIAYSSFAGEGAWVYKSARHGQNTIRPRKRFSTNTAEAAIDAAVAGLGVARVLSYQAAAAVADGKLRVVLGDYDDTVIPVHVVHRPMRIPKPQVKAFVTFATKALRERLASETN